MTTQAPQVLEPKAGIYKGRVILGSQQYGESKNGNPELLLLVSIPELNRQLTAILYFSADAAQYSKARLRACGWEGDDLRDLKGIDKNEVNIEVRWEPFEGSMKMKVQIMDGGGRFNTAKPLDVNTWAAKVNAITGDAPTAATGNSTAPAASGAPKPPF